jgi:hypothetical protein
LNKIDNFDFQFEQQVINAVLLNKIFYSTNLDSVKTKTETANYLFCDNNTFIVETSNQSEDYSFYASCIKRGCLVKGGLLHR